MKIIKVQPLSRPLSILLRHSLQPGNHNVFSDSRSNRDLDTIMVRIFFTGPSNCKYKSDKVAAGCLRAGVKEVLNFKKSTFIKD